MILSLVTQVCIVVLSTLLVCLKYHNKRAAKLPPGPKGMPIIGNFLDLPCPGIPEFQHWLKHKDAYGPLSSVTVQGQTLVVIHDREAARFLLNKKANSTSSRPQLEFGHRMCGYGDLLVLQQYDRTYRLRRSLMHQQLGTKAAVASYQKIQQVEARRFLLRVLDTPEDLIQHTKT
jgi:fumagillin biosynthesis cytochrome P450 monooxygenase